MRCTFMRCRAGSELLIREKNNERGRIFAEKAITVLESVMGCRLFGIGGSELE